ncbi:MAG: hypothetical protein ACW964_19825 [Candidatus Hodarchaeales archaeon]|jgi:hypothetical protein
MSLAVQKPLIADTLNQQMINDTGIAVAGRKDLNRSFGIDWEWVLFYNGSPSNPFPNLSLISATDPTFDLKQERPNGNIETTSETITYSDAIINSVILQVTHAFFSENGKVLERDLAIYAILQSAGEIQQRQVYGWKAQIEKRNSTLIPIANRFGLTGNSNKDGEFNAGLTGQEMLNQLDTLIKENKIDQSFSSFIVWTMRSKPEMWRNLPLWDYFIKNDGDFSYNKMNQDILSQIRRNLDNSINNPTATKPTGYQFTTWVALNSWSFNPISNKDQSNGINALSDLKDPEQILEAFGKQNRNPNRSGDISLNELPPHAVTRLSRSTGLSWSLPPASELNRDLTAGNGDLPLSKFEQRTKDQIIGAASRITDVKYSQNDAILQVPVRGIQKPDNAFVTLLDDKFLIYLKDVIDNFEAVNREGKDSLGAIYNGNLNGTRGNPAAWVDFWQVMLVMQENIERRAYVLNFVVAATDEELDQRAIDIENGN